MPVPRPLVAIERDKNYTKHKLQARIEQVEQSIARYMEELDRADRQPGFSIRLRVAHIKDKIASLRRQIEEFNVLGRQLQQAPDQQISETDPDARLLTALDLLPSIATSPPSNMFNR